MVEIKNVPAIRFKGFVEQWSHKKIIEIAPLQRGFDLPKSQMEKGEYPVVMSNGINGYHSEFMAKGPGIVTGRSGTIGNVHLIETNYWPHNTALWVTDFHGNQPSYIYYLYKRLDLNRFGTGSGVPTLNRNDVHDKKVYIPNPHEQIEISNYLQRLDKLFSLHQTKVNKLANLKKAMLEKMFPKHGADVPEIRFKGFAGAWEQKEIKALADRYDNLRIPITAENRTPGAVPYYGANGIQDYVDGYTHEGEFILIAEDGANDLKNYPVQYVNGKIWVNNHAHVLQGKNMIASNLFLKYVFSQVNIEPFLVGGGRAKLNAETMMKIEMPVPESIDEQNKIGAYFQNLDKTMTLHQTELEKLNNLKKACLEKMFV